jgi:hypothetical protein
VTVRPFSAARCNEKVQMEEVRVIISASLASMHAPKMVYLPDAPFKFMLGYQYLKGLYCEVPRLCVIY